MSAMKILFKTVLVFGIVMSTLTVMKTVIFNQTGSHFIVNYKANNLVMPFLEDTNGPPSSNFNSDFKNLLERLAERPGLLDSPIQGAPYRYTINVSAIEIHNTSLEWMKTYLKLNKSVKAYLTQPIINDHNYEYIHNPRHMCAESAPEVLVVVASAPGNWEKRMKVRNSSRGDYVRDARNRAILLFFIGKGNSSEQEKIEEEVKRFGDIVQEAFLDVYKNIRLKAVSMLKWASAYCQNADFVIRADDDVKVNLTVLISVMRRTALTHKHFILGRVKVDDNPARDPKSKYFLPYATYPHKKLPRFALGGLLGYPLRTVSLLYQSALRTQPIWLDDVYITGICATKVGVELLNDPSFDFTHKEW